MANSVQKFGDWVSPELVAHPALASDVAKSNDPNATSTVVSHVAGVASVNNAVNENIQTYDTGSLWNNITNAVSGVGSTIMKPVTTALDWLNKPLQEISKDYKFLHAVYTDHGVGAGLLATLGIAAGTGIGLATGTGLVGATAGADIAATGIRQLMGHTVWQDSFAKSEDDNYKVSFGRDFSNALATASDALGQQNWAKQFRDTNSGFGKVVSGATDAVFDVTADPLNVMGKAAFALRDGTYLKVTNGEINNALNFPFTKSTGAFTQWMAAKSQRFLTPQQWDDMRAGKGGFLFNGASNGYNRWLDRVGEIVNSDAQKLTDRLNEQYQAQGVKELVNTTPGAAPDEAVWVPGQNIRTANVRDTAIGMLVQEMGLPRAGAEDIVTNAMRAQSAEDAANIAHDVIKTRLAEGQVEQTLGAGALAPSRSVLRDKLQPVADALANAQKRGPLDVARVYNTFTGYMPTDIPQDTLSQSMHEVDMKSPTAPSALGRAMIFSQNRRMATDFMGQFASAVATGQMGLARAVWKQGMFEMYKGLGLSDDAAQNVWQTLHEVPLSSGESGLYGISREGGELGSYTTNAGQKGNAALFAHQASDTLPIPNYFEVRKTLREQGSALKQLRGNFGKVGDFVAQHYTNTLFKPLALMTAGFGMRVAAAELIPQAARYGITPIIKAGIAYSGAKSQWKINQRALDAQFLADDAERTAARQAALSDGSLESGALADATTTLLSDGEPIAADAVKRGFPAFRNHVSNLNLKFAQKMTSQEQVNFAADMLQRMDGHLPDMLDPGHGGVDAHTAYGDGKLAHAVAVSKSLPGGMGDLNKFRTFLHSDPNFDSAWLRNLQKMSQEPGQKRILSDMQSLTNRPTVGLSSEDPEWANTLNALYDREYQRLVAAKQGTGFYGDNPSAKMPDFQRLADGDLRLFAKDRVDGTVSQVIGDNGAVHYGLVDKIANGVKPNIADVSAIRQSAIGALPRATIGQTKYLYVPGGNILQKTIDVGFKKVMDPIVRNVAREPMYLIHSANEYKSLQSAMDNGFIDHDTAMKIAMARGAYAMLPEIHNVMLRSQFAQLARNYLPFYFAQEQAMRRTLRAMRDTSAASPLLSSAFRYYTMLEHSLSDPSIVTQDGSGNSYMNLPMFGPLGQWLQRGMQFFGMPMVSNLPLSVSGNLASLQSVLPEATLPGVSPFAAYGIDLFNRLMPEFGPKPVQDVITAAKDLGTAVAGKSANRGFWDTVIPNAPIKNLYMALSFDEQQAAVSNAMLTAIAAAGYHGQIPSATASDAVKQNFIDNIKNNARSVLIIKALFGMVSPLAPKVEQTDPGLREEFMNLVRQTGDYTKALTKFIGEHGDKAISYTISKTQAAVSGANIQYTQPVVDWLKQHDALVQNADTSIGALYLLPQNPSKTVDWNVYNELIRQHLRSQRTPDQFLKQFYIASGDQAISQAMAVHDQHVVAYKNIPFLNQQEQKNWSTELNAMKTLYPDWYTAYTSGTGKENAVLAVNQLANIFSRPDAPADQQAQDVRALLTDYERHATAVGTWRQLNNTFMAKMETDSWNQHLAAMVAANPNLSTVVNSVFGKLG